MSDDSDARAQLNHVGASLAVLIENLTAIAAAVARLELRIVALEARLIVQNGSMGAPTGDSAPGVITPAEPNAPR